jgi:plastocyanin
MRKGIAVALLVGAFAMEAAAAIAAEKKVKIRDDCDPADPAWDATNGCTLRGGDVTFDEFASLLFSPLSGGALIGHPGWWMDPNYFKIAAGKSVKVENVGGREHTFTEVANFGGGFVPPLNGTLTIAPECAAAAAEPLLAPGGKLEVTGLSEGNHLFQCCIHPWMRILIKVEAKTSSEPEHQH